FDARAPRRGRLGAARMGRTGAGDRAGVLHGRQYARSPRFAAPGSVGRFSRGCRAGRLGETPPAESGLKSQRFGLAGGFFALASAATLRRKASMMLTTLDGVSSGSCLDAVLCGSPFFFSLISSLSRSWTG